MTPTIQTHIRKLLLIVATSANFTSLYGEAIHVQQWLCILGKLQVWLQRSEIVQ